MGEETTGYPQLAMAYVSVVLLRRVQTFSGFWENGQMRRYGVNDGQWDRIKDLLPGRYGHAGGVAANNRLFVEAVLYRYRATIPWCDLPFQGLEKCASASASLV